MRLRRANRGPFLIAALSVIAFSNCECEPALQRVAPKIEIADPFDPSVSVCAEQGIRECAYDFGEVQIGQARLFRFLLKNPSPVELQVSSIVMSDDSDPAFTLKGELPKAVAAGSGDAGEEVVVQFTPTVESEVTGSVVISSDAANLDPDEQVIIHFVGRGLDLGAPEISVNPTACDFGDVGTGVTAFCDLSLENVGQRELLITGIGFTPDTDQSVFGPAGVFPIPTTVQTAAGVSLRLWAKPDTAGEITGTLLIDSTDPLNPQVTVPLRVFGAQAPTAIAEIDSVNGSPPSGNVQVRPLDDVVLTGMNSQPAIASGSITSYQWSIVEQPPESSVELSQPNAMETGFFFSSSTGDRPGLDVAGTFVVSLTVTDDQGLTSTNDARVTLSSVPSERLHVQLTWDSQYNDLDLHLNRSGGPYCDDDNSCNWQNCKATSFSPPEWDGVSGRTAGDPSLDVDDLTGYGPENINVDAPGNDTYTSAVHYFSGSVETYATVKIYVNGGLAFERSAQVSNSNDKWEVAEVQWQNGGAIVAPIDNYLSNWGCPF